MKNTAPPDTRSPEADLALIRSMMAAGRKRAGINGSHLVLWGLLLSGTFFLQYASIMGWIMRLNTELWIGMMVVGWAGSIYLGKKNGPHRSGDNPALNAYASAWLAVGITMALFIVASIFGNGGHSNTTATILSTGVMGCAFFVMAFVLKLKPLFPIAFCWWAIMVYAASVPHFSRDMVLVLGTANAFLVLGPGLYLRRLAKDES